MKISQAYHKAAETLSERRGGTLAFLAAEGALTLACLAPLLFLAEKGPIKYAAALAGVLWLLVMNHVRVNSAAAMQDALNGGNLFSLRLADPAGWRRNTLYGFSRLIYLAIWGAPLTAALVFAWDQYAGTTDGLTVLNKVYDFGGGDLKTGAIYLLLILAGLIILLLIGMAFHSGDRHARAIGEKGILRGHRCKVLLCRISTLVFLLPLIIAAVIALWRYVPLLNNINGVVSGDVAKPSTTTTLIILGIGFVLTVPFLPMREMVMAAYVNGLKE